MYRNICDQFKQTPGMDTVAGHQVGQLFISITRRLEREDEMIHQIHSGVMRMKIKRSRRMREGNRTKGPT